MSEPTTFDARPHTPGRAAPALPHDLPHQQTQEGDDPNWPASASRGPSVSQN